MLFKIRVFVTAPEKQQRIVGGSVTIIEKYPFAASLLYSRNLFIYRQACGGSIISSRSILTAAHCVDGDTRDRWRIRVGSTFANRGGTVHNPYRLIIHPNYNNRTHDSDVALMLTASISFSDRVRVGTMAGSSYILHDNEAVWAVGWGTTAVGGSSSEELRHVQVWTVNQATCRNRYAELGKTVTDNMLCSGWLDVGGRDQCQGDSGGPLIHEITQSHAAIVGVCSWGEQCALARYPGVNARVSRFTSWIRSNA
ncbi:unnamed protein product [Parnassius apollo]|uniref:limulus clotting factor C n=1 Tax=Parnassius apollo TaxID=110799 RepID=A0A8S3Y1N5_PARAO|nr:unnamed protein product [Parnassius apollo]